MSTQQGPRARPADPPENDLAATDGRDVFWEVHVPGLLAHGRDTGLSDLDVTARFDLSASGGASGSSWTVVVERGVFTSVARSPEDGRDPTILVRLSVEVFHEIATGALDHREAFFAGRIDVEGDIELALRLANLIPALIERFPFDPSRYA